MYPSCQEIPRQGPSGDQPQLWDLREASGLAVRLPQFLGAPLSPSRDGHSFPGSPDCLTPGLKNPELLVGEVNWKQENIPSRAAWLSLSLSLSEGTAVGGWGRLLPDSSPPCAHSHRSSAHRGCSPSGKDPVTWATSPTCAAPVMPEKQEPLTYVAPQSWPSPHPQPCLGHPQLCSR